MQEYGNTSSESDATANGELVALNVPGAESPIYVTEDGWVSVTRACEAMRLEPRAQRDKLKLRSWAANECAFRYTPSAGGQQSTFVISRKALPMWLATINENAVSEEARPTVVAFQAEAAAVLDAYFNRQTTLQDRSALGSKLALDGLSQTRQALKLVEIGMAQNAELIQTVRELVVQIGQFATTNGFAPQRPLAPGVAGETDVSTGELIDYAVYTSAGWLNHVMGMPVVDWEYKKALGQRTAKLARRRGIQPDRTGVSAFGPANKWPGWLWSDAYADLGSVDAYLSDLAGRRASARQRERDSGA